MLWVRDVHVDRQRISNGTSSVTRNSKRKAAGRSDWWYGSNSWLGALCLLLFQIYVARSTSTDEDSTFRGRRCRVTYTPAGTGRELANQKTIQTHILMKILDTERFQVRVVGEELVGGFFTNASLTRYRARHQASASCRYVLRSRIPHSRRDWALGRAPVAQVPDERRGNPNSVLVAQGVRWYTPSTHPPCANLALDLFGSDDGAVGCGQPHKWPQLRRAREEPRVSNVLPPAATTPSTKAP